MSTKHPIGVFDSGYGGLTVLREIRKRLPGHDFIYLGDNARAPYGNRSFETVYEYTLQCVRKLFDMGCPLIILACNTASAKALRSIQQKDLPLTAPENKVLGVIRPTAEIVGKLSNTGHVGVLGTSGTVNSGSYPLEIAKFYPELQVSQESCPMWVPLVENNEIETEGADYFIRRHLDHILAKDRKIDTLILGCTHYPLLLKKIRQHLPSHVQIISQGEIVSASLQDYLIRHPEIDQKCTKQGSLQFYTTDSAENFDRGASIFFGEQVHSVHAGF